MSPTYRVLLLLNSFTVHTESSAARAEKMERFRAYSAAAAAAVATRM